jgi:hypothetical protein
MSESRQMRPVSSRSCLTDRRQDMKSYLARTPARFSTVPPVEGMFPLRFWVFSRMSALSSQSPAGADETAPQHWRPRRKGGNFLQHRVQLRPGPQWPCSMGSVHLGLLPQDPAVAWRNTTCDRCIQTSGGWRHPRSFTTIAFIQDHM